MYADDVLLLFESELFFQAELSKKKQQKNQPKTIISRVDFI